ncbi:hypothetical protein HanRHA438_Chr12g0553871 [Helianthus annuus]|nr:hypothetical protein HanRHA438_Chr12g0553871 [Helianthus annuus]
MPSSGMLICRFPFELILDVELSLSCSCNSLSATSANNSKAQIPPSSDDLLRRILL